MSTRMKRILGLACLLGFQATATIAATLTTPPFPGLIVSAGQVVCSATNLGSSDAFVTYELLDDYGFVLSSNKNFILPPGRTYAAVGASLSNTSASVCRFTYGGGKIRASLNWIGAGAVTVIPATK